ncbi:MAG: hypothetical protein ABSH51_05340 [Solirubrobacteraceae bacterium]
MPDRVETALEASCGVLVTLESIHRHADESTSELLTVQAHVQQAIESLRRAIAELRLARTKSPSPMALGFVAAASNEPLAGES